MSIDRRGALKAIPVMAGAALASPAVAQGRVTMRAATVFPVASEGPGAAVRRMAQVIEEISGGTLHIELVDHPTEGLSLYRGVADGSIDMCFAAEEMWRELNPAFALFTSPPGGMTASEFESWIKWGGGQDAWAALSASAGVTPFLVGDTGPSQTLLAAPTLSMESFGGLTVQATGLTADVWKILGAGTVTDMHSSRGVAAADIYNGDDAMSALRFHFGHYTARLTTAVNRMNNAISLSVNSARLSGLADDHRALLELAANREHIAQRIDATLISHRTTEIVLGLTPVEPPPDLGAAQAIAINSLLSDVSGFDGLAADAVWSFQLHQEDSAGWNNIGEGAYLQARNAAEGVR